MQRYRADDLFRRDERGRTPLFYAAEQGDFQTVWDMIFSVRGTGLFPRRMALLEIEDDAGHTAAVVAETHGHDEIADLLRREQMRMDMFE